MRDDVPPDPAETRPPPIAPQAARSHLRVGRGKAAARGALWSLVNMATATLTTTLVFLVTSRFLLPQDFGAVALAVAIVSLSGVVAPIAFGEALIQRAEVNENHLDTVFWVTFLIGAGVWLLLLVLAPLIAALADAPLLVQLLPFIGLRLVFDVLATVPNALIVREMRFRAVALRTAVANLTGGAVCLGMVWQGYGLWALAASQVVIPFAALLVLVPAARWRPGTRVERQALRDLWSYGIFASGNRMLQMMRLDQILIGVMAGPVLLGLYFFAHRLFQILSDLTAGMFSPVAHVLLSSLQNDPDKRREAFLLASYASAMMAFPVFAGLIAVAPSAVPMVFGPQWQGALPAVQGLGVIGLLAGVSIAQSALILGMGRSDWWFWYQGAVQFTLLPVIALLVPLGLSEVMLGFVIHRLLLWPVSVWMTLRLSGLSLRAYAANLAAPAIGAGVMVLVVMQVPTLAAPLAGAPLLAVQVLAGICVHLLVAGLLSRPRLAQIARLVRARRG